MNNFDKKTYLREKGTEKSEMKRQYCIWNHLVHLGNSALQSDDLFREVQKPEALCWHGSQAAKPNMTGARLSGKKQLFVQMIWDTMKSDFVAISRRI